MPRFLVAFLIAGVCAAQDKPSFSTGVSLVHVDVEVLDGSRLLTGLKQTDFRILDNNSPAKILYFAQEEIPLDMILLFDVSGSMRPKLERLRNAAHAAFGELRKGDRVSVMTFAGRTQIEEPFTDDLDEVERTVFDRVLRRARGGTRIIAAINETAGLFLHEPRSDHRRAILIVTDNHGMPSGRKETAVRNLWEADATLSGIEIRLTGERIARRVRLITNPAASLLDSETMSGIVEETGGDLLKGGEPGEEFQEAIRRLRLRYSLYFAMPEGKPGEVRKLKVTLSDDARTQYPQAHVRARSGYQLPKSRK